MDYELSFSGSNVPQTTGPFTGNGKLALEAGNGDAINVSRFYVAKTVDYASGRIGPNVVQPFLPFGLKLVDPADAAIEYGLVEQRVNMDAGVVTTRHSVQRASTHVADVETSLMCLRHLPFCTLQSAVITNVGASTLRVFHEVTTKDNILPAAAPGGLYETQVRYVGNDQVIMQLIGSGESIPDKKRVAFASAYLFDFSECANPATASVRPLGTGTASLRPNDVFNAFEIVGLTPLDCTVKLHVLTSTATTDDFDEPKVEVARITTNICTFSPLATTVRDLALHLRSKHVEAWRNLWKARLQIAPVTDATQAQRTEVSTLNKYLNASLYRIWCCVRENVNIGINPTAINVIDMDGSILFEGDIWLVPLLIILRPALARPLLEHRARNLPHAKQLASAYGYGGAKFPYTDDVLGFKNTMFYSDGAAAHVFNTALIAVNIWNYYRVSKDKEWLRDVGFACIKEIANFLADIVTYSEDTGRYSLKYIVALDDTRMQDNNAFTVCTVKLALKAAIESSYVFSSEVPTPWLEAYNFLPLSNVPNTNVLRHDAAYTGESLNVPEALLPFVPGLWDILYNTGGSSRLSFLDAAADTLAYYRTRMNDGVDEKPFNIGALALLCGIGMSENASKLVEFVQLVNKFVANSVASPWLDMRGMFDASKGPTAQNSLNTNALFLQIFLQGMLQTRAVGGVAESRFFYEGLGIKSLSAVTMPSSWQTLSVSTIGVGSGAPPKTIDARQRLAEFTAVAKGGVTTRDGDFSIFTV